MTKIFNEKLQHTQSRIANSETTSIHMLDKNEQSEDVSYDLKLRALNKLMEADWNRYPSASYRSIESKIAKYVNLKTDNIVLASGSATIITCLLNYFALNNKKIFIAQPSYSLFDYHCKTYNIPYTPWLLNTNLEFDYKNIPSLDCNSVFIITSPNNPTGNCIDTDILEILLQTNPESMIILDGVYTEFCETNITPLINKYPNLLVLRSFSKAFPIAGLRLGYLCAEASLAAIIKKLILQFAINPFSLCFAEEILFNEQFLEESKRRINKIKLQREYMANLLSFKFDEEIIKVFPSQGNFLLIRIHNEMHFKNLLDDLQIAGIKILNTSNCTLLKNTIRVSIGNEHDNEKFINCFTQSIVSSCYQKILLSEI